MTKDEMVGMWHSHNEHAFEQALGVGDMDRESFCMLPPMGLQRVDTNETELNSAELSPSSKNKRLCCLKMCHFKPLLKHNPNVAYIKC